MSHEPVIRMRVDFLPPSVNEYMKYKVVKRGDKHYVEGYESKEAVEFKRYFRDKARYYIDKYDWDKFATEDFNQHWYLELRYTLARRNQDCHNYDKVLIDAMTGVLIIDDRNIIPRTQHVVYDSKNPNIEFILHKASYYGVFHSSDSRSYFVENTCKSCRFYRGGACKILKESSDGTVNSHIAISKKEVTCSKYTKKK